jgi:CRP-like cAMP-binding protein
VDKLNKFYKQFHVKKFAKGEIILVQGEVPPASYVIKKGIIKTYNLTAQGEEKPISFDIQNEMFPVGWVFRHLRFAQYYYEAFTDCEVYVIPRDEYINFLKSNPDSMFEQYSGFISRHLNHQMRINALEQSKAASKVVNTIHFLALRFGRDIKKDLVKIQLPFTQQDLANFMGLTRETTGIELKKLQRKGVLTYKRQFYIVHTDKLGELLDDDFDHGRIDSQP